jgi:ubiquitin-protein ligase
MSMQTLIRVIREIQDVNADFHSLRTVLKETDHKLKWNFVMFPNDGAMSRLPLIGELIIRPTYPCDPPVLHLFTQTGRYNIDVFRSYMHDERQSTMCFDILRSREHGGTWDSRYTVSCLFASLMQALVTPMVPQEYGPDLAEFVSMEKLDGIKRNVQKTYAEHKDKIPRLPVVPTISATRVSAKPLRFMHSWQRTITRALEFRGNDTYISQPIYLQCKNNEAWSTLLDLNNLHPGVVFSVILSNKPGTDHLGNHHDTILLRNGVTGTAAKKTDGNKLMWFYHGKPLNDGHLSVCITVSQDQFTMAYQTDGTGSQSFVIHGDTPISKLSKAQIGDVENVPFYLSIFLKRKSGPMGFINVLDQKGRGYIHAASETPLPKYVPTADPAFVKLSLNGEQTTRLQNLIDFYDLGKDFRIRRSMKDPAHQTLIFHKDLPKEQFTDVIRDIYAPLRDKLVELTITAIVADHQCVALITEAPRAVNRTEVPRWPRDKIPHITMRLTDRVQPVYSNHLARRVTEAKQRGEDLVGTIYVQLPQPVTILCPLKFHYN